MIGLLITFLAGISVLIGALIIRATENSHKVEHFSIAMAMSALIALMVVDLMPDIREEAVGAFGWGWTVTFLILGFVGLSLLDKITPDHGHHHGDHEEDEEEHQHDIEHIGLITAAAIILHNIVEGMSVYSLSMVSVKDGALFAVAIALHNIPMGMMIYSTMREAKQTKHEKTIIIGAVTISTLLGGLAMYFISFLMVEQFTGALLCIATGMIVYIVIEEMLPHVIKSKEPRINLMGILLGFIFVLLSSFIG